MSPVWDANPHLTDPDREWLAGLRSRVDSLTSRTAITAWLADADEGGIDPL